MIKFMLAVVALLSVTFTTVKAADDTYDTYQAASYGSDYSSSYYPADTCSTDYSTDTYSYSYWSVSREDTLVMKAVARIKVPKNRMLSYTYNTIKKNGKTFIVIHYRFERPDKNGIFTYSSNYYTK